MKTAKQKKILIEELEKNPVIGFATKRAMIARATYYRWLKKSKKFAKAAEKARDKGVSLINDLAQAQIILMIKDGNLTAIKFWLTHRDPAFSEKLKFIKYSKLNDKKLDNRKLTPEESKLIDEVIELDYGKDWNKKPEKIRTVRIDKTLAYNVAL